MKMETRFTKLVSVRIPHELINAIEDEVKRRQKGRVRRVSCSEVIVDIIEQYFE